MPTTTKFLLGALLGSIVIAVTYFAMGNTTSAVNTRNDAVSNTMHFEENTESQGAAIGAENHVTFTCETGGDIQAVFERDIVGITLSDGEQIVLRQKEVASGIRYLSNDSSIELRGKGNEAMLIENGVVTHDNCIVP